jgi:hypothetical protein
MLLAKFGKPTLEQLLDWQKDGKEITFTTYDSRIKGIITSVDSLNKSMGSYSIG